MADGFEAISLFSGAGGMDVGFDQAGFSIRFANDLDPFACETYRRNGLGEIYPGNLENYWSDLAKFSSPDLVFGGPPCQGFSVAGKMDPEDERSKLMHRFFDVVEMTSPYAFVCENVKALAVLTRWEPLRRKLLKRAEKLGYRTALVVLNSSDFGVPQARERMFLLGIRSDLTKLTNESLRAEFALRLEQHKCETPTMAQVIRRLGRAGSEHNSRVCNAKVTFAKNPVLRRSPYAGMLFNGAGRPLDPKGVSSTLPASMGGNKTPIVDEAEIFDGEPSYVVEYHRMLREGGKPYEGVAPSRLRRLTVDECLAIQTFPEGFELAGQQSARYRQVGNAVPCRLAFCVADSVREILSNISQKQHVGAA